MLSSFLIYLFPLAVYCCKICLAGQHYPGIRVTEASSLITGSCNVCYTVTFEDGFRTRDELLVMGFLALGAGQWGCGPYIATTVVEGTLLSKSFGNPGVHYGVAQVMLELSKPTFRSIGMTKRPLTLNMDELKNYVARCLSLRLTRQIPTETGLFRLFRNNLRPSNALVSGSDLTVTGVIDWGFTYIAPAEFTHTAPWWLLFESPEACESDLNRIFLQRLLDRIALSVENGLFWFCLAARKSFMFDDIYWTILVEKYFSHLSSLDDRLPLNSG
ncbi:hypothetical protein BDY21DRAFT_415169 [Lineolata rhizophorae]|uniref:Aminoglycoside phosphotransferase domain-containing protein n=1 Tax=Lineolata rhizophorae TaxID=578093 RepID=A0A6A6P1B6_9PEZI|nr:hypothetical protein BDY21DRAFT_415169 [Lineolata rhizophorae]